MTELLRAVGASEEVIKQVAAVVDTCRVCRQWRKPHGRSMTSTRMTNHFNELVQLDLLFYLDVTVLHMIDEATRWTAATIISDKQASTVTRAITQLWFRTFGPPTTLMSDHEGGIDIRRRCLVG